jgi:anti-sigma regulatory factor (Ser/Thr protein kinase)
MTAAVTPLRPDREWAFAHKALFYADEAAFLEGTLTFIREGVKTGQPTLVMVGRAKSDLLRTALGDASEAVQFADVSEVGANPAWMIPAWRRFVERHGGPRGLRGVSDPVLSERSPAELVECHIHESLLNLAFADAGPFSLLCPYNTASLDPQVLDEARHCHPHLTDGVRDERSERYRSDDAQLRFAARLPEPPQDAYEFAYDASTLRALRAFVTWHASSAGLRGYRLEDMVLAAHELATNTVRHGGGRGRMRIWAEGGVVIAQADDGGRLSSLMVGRVLPAPDQLEGRGLWLANQLCDLVQIRSCSEGTTVRLHVRADRG